MYALFLLYPTSGCFVGKFWKREPLTSAIKPHIFGIVKPVSPVCPECKHPRAHWVWLISAANRPLYTPSASHVRHERSTEASVRVIFGILLVF